MHEFSAETIESIFLDALGLPADQRATFLEKKCGHNQALRDAVEQLLAADEDAGQQDFLQAALLATEAPPQSSGESGETADRRRDERFRVITEHREGGLGEVLLAHDRQLDRDVAVKQIKSKWKFSDEARERFLREAKVTGRLEHPGIVPVYAMGQWPDGQPYYAMRFIEGETLRDAITRFHQAAALGDDNDLKLRELLTRFVDVCNTIQYAHSKRVLHRDIKPSNVMVGPYGETMVVDWGLAKLLDEPMEESMTAGMAEESPSTGSTPTHVGKAVGTPNYMSPEQAKRTHRSDFDSHRHLSVGRDALPLVGWHAAAQ